LRAVLPQSSSGQTVAAQIFWFCGTTVKQPVRA